jgi:type IV secretory pathway VirB10-like protein
MPRVYEEEEPETISEAPAATSTSSPGYTTYDRRPEVNVRESPFSPDQPLAGQGGSGGMFTESQGRPPARRSIFHDALPVALTPVAAPVLQAAAGQVNDAFRQALSEAKVLESAYASDYQKQNMNSIKEEYLRNARASEDYSSYLGTLSLPPIDPYHEIKAGTFIPITLISSIHSDLPGPIEAQVIENVYDTYSGRNVLIPRGTRVHGEYSSSVAFGQDRVLIVWQRMTRPDGVTINLAAMQGVDLRGMAGLADKVDYHLDEVLIAVGISTVWDIAKAAAVSAMSTAEALRDINEALTAQGSATSSANSAAQQIVTSYANKLLNQQPTITIREGIRGNIFVSKDIILPAYGVVF